MVNHKTKAACTDELQSARVGIHLLFIDLCLACRQQCLGNCVLQQHGLTWLPCTCPWLQVRQVLTEYVVLPLGSQQLHERLPLINTVLLYGAPHTGKTLLTQVRHQVTSGE